MVSVIFGTGLFLHKNHFCTRVTFAGRLFCTRVTFARGSFLHDSFKTFLVGLQDLNLKVDKYLIKHFLVSKLETKIIVLITVLKIHLF